MQLAAERGAGLLDRIFARLRVRDQLLGRDFVVADLAEIIRHGFSSFRCAGFLSMRAAGRARSMMAAFRGAVDGTSVLSRPRGANKQRRGLARSQRIWREFP